jgi:hypothetical protein
MFSFCYEDYSIEVESIINNNINKKFDKGLIILSGGCTMFEISPYFNNLKAIDLNIAQIEHVKQKIKLLNTDEYHNYIKNSEDNFAFDKMFKSIKNIESFDIIFSKENLIKNFGENAVANTDESFAEHFKSIYLKNNINHDWIFNRILTKKNKLYENITSIKSCEIILDNFLNHINIEEEYDFIQTSNITDWMNKSDFDVFCYKVKKALKKNGILIMRRMLSHNILHEKFENCINLHDNTDFYKETILYIK